jgi:hypothetical protein
MANVIRWRIENMKGTYCNVAGRFTTAQRDETQHQKSNLFHPVPLCAISDAAREFRASATNSSISISVVDHEVIKR